MGPPHPLDPVPPVNDFVRAIQRRLFGLGTGSGASFEVEGGSSLSEVRLLCGSAGNPWSKTGRLRWTARLNGRPVKIYECFSESQAELLEYVTTSTSLGEHLPACRLRTGHVIVADWIEGETLSWKRLRRDLRLMEEMARVQSKLHDLRAEPLPAGEIYLAYLKERAGRFKGALPVDAALRSLVESLEASPPALEERLSHPDFTPDNLVLEASTGILKIVDNELLDRNRCYPVDLLNTLHSADGDADADLLEAYLERYIIAGGKPGAFLEHAEFFAALWRLRRVGSLLQAGAIGAAVQLLLHSPTGVDPLVGAVQSVLGRPR